MVKNRDKILSCVLTTGASGMVGSYVDFGIRLDHRALDVTDLGETLAVIKKHNPKVIIHLASETDTDRCEKDPQLAYMVNAIGTYNVALAAKEVGAKMIYISTSAVFDGAKKKPYIETDKLNPQSYYAKSKFLGEVIVKNILKDYIIGRVCWVFGGGPKKDQKFVAKIIKQTKEPIVRIVAGKYGSPTFGKDLVAILRKMIVANKKGVFHLSNKGTPSRFEVAKEIMKLTKSKTKVEKVDQSFFNKTDLHKRLDNESMTSKISLMRPWQEALKDYIESEWLDYIN
ncbi:MAG: NAD(P)-dependent oxidoreductase [Candidatus Paceibacterota bacterium]|jgi:dTDP-4-dehydrorhamnose reductase